MVLVHIVLTLLGVLQMAIINYDVWWGINAHDYFQLDNLKEVDELIETVLRQAGTQLPENDASGHPIYYALYKIENGQRIKIMGRRSLTKANISDGDQLHLVDQ